MDIKPSMEMTGEIAAKVSFLDSLKTGVGVRIGREVKPREVAALGFVVERNWHGQIDDGDFLASVFGIKPEDSPRDAASKISDGIYQESMREKEVRLQTAHAGDMGKLFAIERFVTSLHTDIRAAYSRGEEVDLGAVPDHWVPAWVKI